MYSSCLPGKMGYGFWRMQSYCCDTQEWSSVESSSNSKTQYFIFHYTYNANIGTGSN